MISKNVDYNCSACNLYTTVKFFLNAFDCVVCSPTNVDYISKSSHGLFRAGTLSGIRDL